MSDQVARAVGAGGTGTVEIAGKTCRAKPLSIRELTEVERDCLARYKRGYIQTFVDNLDVVPEDMRERLLSEKMDVAARMDLDDLPTKLAYDAEHLKIVPALKTLIEKHFGEKKVDNVRLRKLLVTMLDQGSLAEERYTEITGHEPYKAKVPYVNWWITAAFEGMITFVWVCFEGNGVTREEVLEELGTDPARLAELSREIEHLSAPKAKNG